MSKMFYESFNFNCDLSNWDVSNVKNMEYMLDNCLNFNHDISNWKLSGDAKTLCMFYSSAVPNKYKCKKTL